MPWPCSLYVEFTEYIACPVHRSGYWIIYQIGKLLDVILLRWQFYFSVLFIQVTLHKSQIYTLHYTKGTINSPISSLSQHITSTEPHNWRIASGVVGRAVWRMLQNACAIKNSMTANLLRLFDWEPFIDLSSRLIIDQACQTKARDKDVSYPSHAKIRTPYHSQLSLCFVNGECTTIWSSGSDKQNSYA